MEEGGEGSSVKPWWKYYSEQAEARAARAARGQDCHYRFGVPVAGTFPDLSTYVDRSEYPLLADIEVEIHWDKLRGRMVSLVPKWAQEEYAARINTPANGRKQDHPNSGSQATDAASSGTKALKRPPVEDPSATDPCGTKALKHPRVEHPFVFAEKQDQPNSASQVTAADNHSFGTTAKVRSCASLIAARKEYAQCSYGWFLEGGRIVRKPKRRGVGIPSKAKSAIKQDAGAQVK